METLGDEGGYSSRMKGEGLIFSGRGHDGVMGERGYNSEGGEMSLIDGRGTENREEND